MSQVSLLFKDRILSIHHLDQYNGFIIGHASDCQIHIDSLAVEPHHAKITYDNHTYLIEAVSQQSKILINNKAIESNAHLSDGDQISLGKHTLVFTFDERNETHEFREPKLITAVSKKSASSGWIQFLNGKKMGKTVQIKQNMTNITDEAEDNIALISNRSDGFYISYLKGEHPPKVNNASIGETSKTLATNSRISIGQQEILFYIN